MYESDLPKSRTALLLVDFINPMDFPEAGDLAPSAALAARRTGALKKALRQRGVPAIYANDNFGKWRSDFPTMCEQLARGKGPAAVMARALRPLRDDLSVLKPRHSAFYGTPLDIILQTMGVKKLIITGLATDICVQLTAADAFLRSLSVHVPSDCTAAETEEAKAAALEHMQRVLRCDVRPSVADAA